MVERDRTEPSKADVRETLRAHGLRYSRPRATILRYFAERDRHVGAEDVYLELRRRGEDLSLSTVYLNLNVLSRAGVVREFQGTGGQKLYDGNPSPHYHLICRETGEVLDVPAPMVDGVPLNQFLKRTIEEATGWEVEEPRIQLRGRSPEAATADPEEGRSEAAS